MLVMKKIPKKNIISYIKLILIFIAICMFLHFTKIGCPIKFLTGISCPGCGMTRAWLSVLHFNFSDAFYYHPLFWIVPIVLLIEIFKEKIPKKLYKYLMFFNTTLILVVYIIRLLDNNNPIVSINIDRGVFFKIYIYIRRNILCI